MNNPSFLVIRPLANLCCPFSSCIGEERRRQRIPYTKYCNESPGNDDTCSSVRLSVRSLSPTCIIQSHPVDRTTTTAIYIISISPRSRSPALSALSSFPRHRKSPWRQYVDRPRPGAGGQTAPAIVAVPSFLPAYTLRSSFRFRQRTDGTATGNGGKLKLPGRAGRAPRRNERGGNLARCFSALTACCRRVHNN